MRTGESVPREDEEIERVEKSEALPGEGGGAGGGRPLGWRSGGGGGNGGGNASKAGCVAKKVATRSGDDHRSSGESVVGRAGQSKRCSTVCGSRSHSGQMSSGALPMRC